MVRKITRDELLKMRKEMKKLTLVDVLTRESYEKEHIPGSISVPLAELGDKAFQLFNKDDTLVVYCANFECQASTMAAEKLEKMGFKNVLDYKGGLKDYKEGGLALEGSINECASCASCRSCG